MGLSCYRYRNFKLNNLNLKHSIAVKNIAATLRQNPSKSPSCSLEAQLQISRP